jgi:hypothetical protein
VQDCLYQRESQKLKEFQNQESSAGMNDKVCCYCTILHNRECHDLICVIIRYRNLSLDTQGNFILMKQHHSYRQTGIKSEWHSQITEQQSGKD